MKHITHVNIIGAGMAGCEAAYQLAKQHIYVKLYEVKRLKKNPVQHLDGFAELVCSNSLRSNDPGNAVGTLKAEMRLMDSLIIRAAEQASVPAGGSLAVDREIFSSIITNELHANPYIEIIDQDFSEIDPEQITMICSGPLTSDALQQSLIKLLGSQDFYFYDAIAPIIQKNSINMDIAYQKNRYDKGDTKDYINCPMTQSEYEAFYQALITAEVAIGHLPGEADLIYFEGCMPVEVMAKRGPKTLLFGPMKPKGLNKLNGDRNYAVVQLRQDDANDNLYNLVGFQTNLKWKDQQRVFQMIPGLENASFVRYGVMHKNNFINTPTLLNEFMQLKTNSNIFFAGQITGVEGYVESAASGLVVGLNIANYFYHKQLVLPSSKTVCGALMHYIHHASTTNFQPMKANWGIVNGFANLSSSHKIPKHQLKQAKNSLRSQIALKDLNDFLKEYNNL